MVGPLRDSSSQNRSDSVPHTRQYRFAPYIDPRARSVSPASPNCRPASRLWLESENPGWIGTCRYFISMGHTNWCVPDGAVNPPQFYYSLEEINETRRAHGCREVVGRSEALIEPQPAVPSQAAQENVPEARFPVPHMPQAVHARGPATAPVEAMGMLTNEAEPPAIPSPLTGEVFIYIYLCVLADMSACCRTCCSCWCCVLSHY